MRGKCSHIFSLLVELSRLPSGPILVFPDVLQNRRTETETAILFSMDPLLTGLPAILLPNRSQRKRYLLRIPFACVRAGAEAHRPAVSQQLAIPGNENA